MSKRSRAFAVSFIISRSLSLPMMMETSGFLSMFSVFYLLAVSSFCKDARPGKKDLTLEAAMSNVTAVLHAIEADAPYGLVGSGHGRLQGGCAGRDAENASSGGCDLTIDKAGTSVKDLDPV